MLHIPLALVDETALRQLATDQIEESSRLEFKQSLNLATREARCEVAKDVSAMANSAGGRIVYGIAESDRADGARSAGTLIPLPDASIQASLENVIADAISPRPRYEIKKVTVDGGVVLVLELYPSFGLDLHMVTAYDEGRFYRRAEQRVYRMSEAEVREAYARIARANADLERRIDEQVNHAREVRRGARESIIVAPWFSRPLLVDPRRFDTLRSDPPREIATDHTMLELVRGLEITGEGLSAVLPFGSTDMYPWAYLAIHKNGLIHLSYTHGFVGDRYHVPGLVKDLFQALTLAGIVLDRAGYWGPVRVLHVLRSVDAPIKIRRFERDFADFAIPAGVHDHHVAEVNLQQVRNGPGIVIREIVDQVFQDAGIPQSPYFDGAARVNQAFREQLPLGLS